MSDFSIATEDTIRVAQHLGTRYLTPELATMINRMLWIHRGDAGRALADVRQALQIERHQRA